MIDLQERAKKREKAILIGVTRSGQPEEKTAEYLEELAFLTETAGAVVDRVFTQKLQIPHPKTYIGTGKVEEIVAYIQEAEVDLVVFDDELSPAQIKNVEAQMKVKVLDRTNLILDIFAARAQTSYARTQVELAQYEYLLPRLTRMWTHLERQKGGIGMRGPGETQIETDRRIIQQKIALLKEKLKKIDRQMATQRSNRGSLVRVALVGYTNVGKSTLMNLMAKTEVLAENKLFATLDTTVRKISIQNLPLLISDTVGFIRKLPTQLVESFKSTLDEVREADVLLHVVDISHPAFEDHIAAVNTIIHEIDQREKPTIMVFNKIDQYVEPDPEDLTESRHLTLEEWKQTWMARTNGTCVFISAKERENMEELRRKLYAKGAEIHRSRFPFDTFLY